MFNWMKPTGPTAPFSPGNPGRGAPYKSAFANGERTWSEEGDTLAALAAVLKAQGLKFMRGEAHLQLENELFVRPQIVIVRPGDNGSVNTTTTIEVNHPKLCPNGTFEYQHGIGNSVEDSLKKGFAGWVDCDLPVFADAVREKVKTCMTIQMDPNRDTSILAQHRQVILGPPLHAKIWTTADAPDEHGFCPCCLFTNSIEAFRDHLQGNEFHGIRLYASRDANGAAVADCRINGLDWAPGAAALLKYVTTWPERGFEYRKQFVAIRTLLLK